MRALLMRSIFLATGFLVASWTAPASAQLAEFRGGGYLGDAQGCESQGWGGLTQFVARWRPVGQAGDRDSSLSLYFNEYTVNFRFPEGAVESRNWVNATRIGGVGDTAFVYSPDPPTRIRLTDPPGFTVINRDNEIHELFEIQNFNGLAGCSVRGEIWLHRL